MIGGKNCHQNYRNIVKYTHTLA